MKRAIFIFSSNNFVFVYTPQLVSLWTSMQLLFQGSDYDGRIMKIIQTHNLTLHCNP